MPSEASLSTTPLLQLIQLKYMGVHVYVHVHRHTRAVRYSVSLSDQGSVVCSNRSLPAFEFVVFCALSFCNTFSASNITSFLKHPVHLLQNELLPAPFPCGPLNKTYCNTYFKDYSNYCLSVSFFLLAG